MGGLSQATEYNIGDTVEVAATQVPVAYLATSCWKHNPHPYTGPVGPTTHVVWTSAIVVHKSTYKNLFEYELAHPNDNGSRIYIPYDMSGSNLRPGVAPPPTEPIKMANGCLHCKNIFTYPVEYNHKDGRLCFSCKSTYGWKYF